MPNKNRTLETNPNPALRTPRPEFVARAKVAPDGDQWITIGYAWAYERVRGERGYTVKLDSAPIHWDGSFYLAPLPRKPEARKNDA